jgi:hypothetical protein
MDRAVAHHVSAVAAAAVVDAGIDATSIVLKLCANVESESVEALGERLHQFGEECARRESTGVAILCPEDERRAEAWLFVVLRRGLRGEGTDTAVTRPSLLFRRITREEIAARTAERPGGVTVCRIGDEEAVDGANEARDVQVTNSVGA